MRNDPRERALEVCLQQLQTGSSIEQLLEMYPHWAEELRPVLQTAQAAQQVADAVKKSTDSEVFQAARLRSRTKMLAALEAGTKTRRPLQQGQPQARGLRLGFAILVLLVLVGAGAFTSVSAAARALPGERLYPLKIASEKARLTFTRSSEARLELEQAFDEERKEEVAELIEGAGGSGQDLDVHFAGTLTDRQPGSWLVGGIHIVVPDDARLVGQIQTGIVVEVRGHLQTDGSVLASSIRPREFEITGVLQKIEGSGWVVDDVAFVITPDTALLGAENGQPMPGVKVRAKVFWLPGQGLQARLIELNPSGKSPEIDDEIGNAPAEEITEDQPQTTPEPSASPQGTIDVPATTETVEPIKASAEPEIETGANANEDSSIQQAGETEETIETEETEAVSENEDSHIGGNENADLRSISAASGGSSVANKRPVAASSRCTAWRRSATARTCESGENAAAAE